jgi:hypothetical protein
MDDAGKGAYRVAVAISGPGFHVDLVVDGLRRLDHDLMTMTVDQILRQLDQLDASPEATDE